MLAAIIPNLFGSVQNGKLMQEARVGRDVASALELQKVSEAAKVLATKIRYKANVFLNFYNSTIESWIRKFLVHPLL